MNNDKYNYTLNGIEHEIILNDRLNIDKKPINEKILVSNKFLLKYINDLFDFNKIEYSLINNSLLGLYVFNGVNIFNQKLEIVTIDSNFYKIKKLENDIKENGFNIEFIDNIIKINTIFYDKIKVEVIIYQLLNDSHTDQFYHNFENKIINYNFYDIYPIKKYKFEEFEISGPNKIDEILSKYNFDLNYISFTKNKKDNKKIILEKEKEQNYIQNFISIIKPFFFTN